MEVPQIKSNKINNQNFFSLSRQRYKVWTISGFAILISLIGLISSWLNPSIGLPLRAGLDFTGGTQIRLERKCQKECGLISTISISNALNDISDSNEGIPYQKLDGARIQFLDGYKSLLIRTPTLSAFESKKVIDSVVNIAGPFDEGGQSIETIGPTLGKKLLRTSLISLLVAFLLISTYISIRFDRKYAFLALLALSHDVIIVCGVFAWLGIFQNIEVNSLFAVALLTIAGYSVNDTVVVFDRVREINRSKINLSLKQKIDLAVSATLTRTLYTTGTTLLPLLALIFFGGTTLYWFAIALALGVIVGSWSSIALAPSLLSLSND
ncbi:protein translocase subunit SecF [Prochlorococcus marinus]|uniref:protein translocase subunit SecF n=1 Tax=Prochlorococcus marinus TaxID=1219 RepID=UPI0022B547DF|nr:protein translocase subunit SecF [Prochlorococcus marinus]